MPHDEKPTIEDLEKRLKILEASKLTVKQLPMNELRKALAREPQNPNDTLLPHSIGASLLKESVAPGLTHTYMQIPVNQTATNVAAGIVPNSLTAIPVDGVWWFFASGDFITGVALPILRFGKSDLTIVGNQNVYPASFRGGLAMQSSAAVTYKAGEQVGIRQEQTGAGTQTYIDIAITGIKLG